MQVGYARVSTTDQKLLLQTDALKLAGCKKIFCDKISGIRIERPGFQRMLDHLQKGDTLIVWKLDRLGRSLQHLIQTVNVLEAKGVGFRSIQENIDTNTSGGKLVFHIFGAIAEFERSLISERTRAGLHSAKLRGRFGGRPVVINEIKRKRLNFLHLNRKLSVNDICRELDISKSTFYRYVKNNLL
jgi:DNA invertase Pin-like site-specific DNA recombinase